MASIRQLLQNYWILLFILIAKMILQLLVVNPVYELHRDEFLYLDQAKHLAAGYISVPPLTAWVSCLVFALGGGEFWVRFFPALFGALTLLLAWLMVEELGGRYTLKYSYLVPFCSPYLFALTFCTSPMPLTSWHGQLSFIS